MKMKTDELIDLVMKKAHYHHKGHVMLIRFTKGWKVVFGTPDLKKEIPILRSIDDTLGLDDALYLAIIQDPIIGPHGTLHKQRDAKK